MNKHKKIYELTGICPALWVSPDGEDFGRVYWKDYKPHYPCEQLWERLPESVETYEKQTPLAYLTSYKGIVGYYKFAEVGEWFEFRQNDNLQEALLDMVLWAIENGHVKIK